MAVVAEATTTAVPARYRLRWYALAAVLATHCMDLLDSMMVSTAGPTIRTGLHGSYSDLQWMVAGYTLAFATMLITGGRLGDIFGLKRMFLVGTIGFTVASVIAGLSVNTEMLIGVRSLQGLCAAIMVPQGLGIMRELFPGRELPKAIGMMGPVVGMAAIIGPILGGALASGDLFGLGWRAVFFVNAPIGLAAVLGGLKLIPGARPTDRARARRLDGVGTALAAAAMLLLAYPLMQGRDKGWPAWCFISMAAALPVLVVFAMHQRRRGAAGRTPLVELGLFHNMRFVVALLLGMLYYVAISGMMFSLIVQLQLGHGFSALDAGLVMMPWTLGSAIGAAIAGAVLVRRWGDRTTLQAGLGALAVGAVALTVVVANIHSTDQVVTAWQLLPALLVIGLGMGGVLTPYYNIALVSVAIKETGSASGLLNAFQQVGNSIGVAALGTVFLSCLTHGGTGGFDGAMQVTFWIAAGLLTVAFASAFLLPTRTHHRED